jgi:hypothetical protein
MPLDAWAAAIAEAADSLTAAPGRDTWQRVQLGRMLEDVVAEGTSAGTVTQTALALAEIRALLADRLRGRPTRASFRTGHLTIWRARKGSRCWRADRSGSAPDHVARAGRACEPANPTRCVLWWATYSRSTRLSWPRETSLPGSRSSRYAASAESAGCECTSWSVSFVSLPSYTGGGVRGQWPGRRVDVTVFASDSSDVECL